MVGNRAGRVRQAAMALCVRLGWAPLHEVRLANGRRADILALQRRGGFAIIEVKSGLRDYIEDEKWEEYLPFCEQFFFAVDSDFPHAVLPAEAGLIVCAPLGAAIVREPPVARALAPQRRKALIERFARTAVRRLLALDPMGVADFMVEEE